MKKNGFTLIELLGTIIIIAIIAIITIPLVINVIEKARKGALKSSVYGIVDASQLYYQKYMLDDNSFRLLEFENNEQKDSYDKLAYKGNIKHGFVGIGENGNAAVCIDDNKYYASKALNSLDVIVDEGTCTDEFDEDIAAFITTGVANYVGFRLNVKEYASSNDLPKTSSEGNVGVITNTKVTDYYVGPSHYPPETVKEGMVWLIQNSKAPNAIITKNSRIGISYVTQYENGEWQLKESYVYNNNKWEQLSYLNDLVKWEYDYTGKYQKFEAPYSGYYTIELWGASGGDLNTSYLGGNGAYTKGDIYLNTGEEIYIYVGGQGGAVSTPGWNGGGLGHGGATSGGGATDVRTVATSTETSWNESSSMASRIMVAGAGSGASVHSGTAWASQGGSAGGLESYLGETGGSSAGYIGTVATQTVGGKPLTTTYPASSGTFGKGGDANQTYDVGGGGSGWYGGVGGSYAGGPASGGSSYISGHFGCLSVDHDLHAYGESKSITGKYFINTTMIDGNGYKWTSFRVKNTGMPSHTDGKTISGNDGNGYAKITLKSFAAYTEKQYENLYESPEIWNFSYSGYYQTFTAPKSGYYTVELWGASGGDLNATYLGGNGAYTKGDIYLNAKEKLYVFVGGEGGLVASPGWNGGGLGHSGATSGGGATDIRTMAPTNETTWNETSSLTSRIMVAGAGSGASVHSGTAWASQGGAAGGLESYLGESGGSSAGYPGTIATQTVGGKPLTTTYPASSGTFGKGGDANQTYDVGGGGSGWYGGVGGSYAGGPASGGSSYISGHFGCLSVDRNLHAYGESKSITGKYFTNTLMVDGQGYKWTSMKTENTGFPDRRNNELVAGNDGDGFAKITFKKAASLTDAQYTSAYDDPYIWNYSHTGYYQVFEVPKTGTYKIELWGASGGDLNASYLGGTGGYTSGEISLQKDTKLYVYVGGEGGLVASPGWNGGGLGHGGATSGGGSTDIRTVPTSIVTTWNEVSSLRSRIMVAGAGSGASVHSGTAWASQGGAAGGLESYLGESGGSSAGYSGTVATQTIGGAPLTATYPASSGTFGKGGDANQTYDVGGGGSGWYGGVGGSYAGGPASGGSSYISGHDGCIGVELDGTAKSNSESNTGYKFTKTKMVDGQGYKWTTTKGNTIGITSYKDGSTVSGNDGNGFARITLIK